MIDDVCNCGVGEGGVGEGKCGGFLEVDGRKFGMESVGRGFQQFMGIRHFFLLHQVQYFRPILGLVLLV